MRKLFIVSVLMICLQSVGAQKLDTIYYDSNWKGVPIKSFAAYKAIVYMSDGSQYENMEKSYYITGELQGEFTPIYIDKFDGDKSKYKGHFTTYYKSGGKEVEGYHNDSGEYEGEYVQYYENGNIKANFNIKNGQPEGEQRNYYENGKLSELSVYNNGVGQSKTTYYESGALNFKSTYKNEKVNGTFFQYLEDGSGHYETEMLAGEKVSNMTTFEDSNGNRIKYNLESKEVIQDKPTLSDMKSTVSNGATFLYYKMNGIFLAVNTTISSDNGKYFLASIVVGNNLNQSIQFEADKLSGYVEKDVKTYTCKVYTSDEFATIVGKKLRSKSFWNSVGQNLATMNAGVSTSSTSTLSAGYVNSAALAADNNGNVVAGVGSAYGANSTVSQTQTYNAGAQYQANQNAQRNISEYNNQLEQYQSALDEGYLKSNVIESGKSITGNMNIKYQKGDKFILYIPLNGSVYQFQWSI